MVLLPAILASLALVYTLVGIFLTITVIIKIGLSILCVKKHIKPWRGLWLPFIYGWYESGIVSKFIKRSHKPNKAFQIIWTILHIASFTCIIVAYYLAPDYRDPRGDLYVDICGYLMVAVSIFKIVFRNIAMIRGGKKWWNIFIGWFISPFWPYLMLKNSIDLEE